MSVKIDAFCPVGIGGTKGIDTTHLKVFVGGLSQTHSSKDLFAAFKEFGEIREAVVIPDRFRVRSRCYGFVTFVDPKSVSRVFKHGPVKTSDGTKLTVVLASSNTKPRRAHFNVRHGTSGHKPLPTVQEKQEDARKVITEKDKKAVGIYSDPSLFRTANIQPIAPASFRVKRKHVQQRPNAPYWPNEDIRKDFTSLMKMNPSTGKMGTSTKSVNKQSKSWKVISDRNNAKNTNSNHGDDVASVSSVRSKQWTSIPPRRHHQTSVSNDARDRRNGGTGILHRNQCQYQGSPQSNKATRHGNSQHDDDEMDLLFSLFAISPTKNRDHGSSNGELHSLRSSFKEKMEAGIAGRSVSNNQMFGNNHFVNVSLNDSANYHCQQNSNNAEGSANVYGNAEAGNSNIWYENGFGYSPNYYSGMTAQQCETQNMMESTPLMMVPNHNAYSGSMSFSNNGKAVMNGNEKWGNLENSSLLSNFYAVPLQMTSSNNIAM